MTRESNRSERYESPLSIQLGIKLYDYCSLWRWLALNKETKWKHTHTHTHTYIYIYIYIYIIKPMKISSSYYHNIIISLMYQLYNIWHQIKLYLNKLLLFIYLFIFTALLATIWALFESSNWCLHAHTNA